jgi:hypothetical protein
MMGSGFIVTAARTAPKIERLIFGADPCVANLHAFAPDVF